MQDVLSDVGYLGLGSRLKRLADRMLVDAAQIHVDSGEPIQPGQFPLVAALDRYGGLTVNDAAAALGVSQPAITRAAAELVNEGLATSSIAEDDKRQRILDLTPKGKACVGRLKKVTWPRVEAAAREVFSDLPNDILSQLATLEERLTKKSMLERVRTSSLEIVPWSDDLAQTFFDINEEWIKAMFVMEDHDRRIITYPRETILDKGGKILFVRDTDLGIVGTCALLPDTDGFTELTKMGVLSSARGRKAGEFLLRAIIEVARECGFDQKLYLVTNWKCEAAIHLYEKVGFVHDKEMMEQFGSRYERCNVAMRYTPQTTQ